MVKNNGKSNGDGKSNGKVKRGRPSTFDQAVADEVCQRMSVGESLRQICRDTHIPSHTTILQWMIEDREGFSDQYTRARAAQAEYWAEEILEIADDGSNDWMKRETQSGAIIEVTDHEHINRSKLRVDARKWLMARMAPKRFGDKVTADVNATITVRTMELEFDRQG